MTVSVTMTVTRMGEDGTLWEAGTTHTATEHFAKHLVQFNWATAEFLGTTGFTTARAYVTPDDQFQFLDHKGQILAPINVFIPFPGSENAKDNMVALQDRLDAIAASSTGGELLIDFDGIYYLENSLICGSNTKLTHSARSKPTYPQIHGAGSAQPMVVTRQLANRSSAPTVTLTWSAGSINATVNQTAHGQVAGGYYELLGSTVSAFNGVFPILSVTNANAFVITLNYVPSAAPAGTIKGQPATTNVEIVGGVWDYGAPSNYGTLGVNQYLMHLSGQNIRVHDLQIKNSSAQAIVFSSDRDCQTYSVDCPVTASGVMQIHGPSFNNHISNLSCAIAGDDGISYSCAPTTGFETYQTSTGDIIGYSATNINIVENSTSGVGMITLYPTATEKLQGGKLQTIRGRVQNGSALRVFGYNDAGTPTIGHLVADDIDVCCLVAVDMLLAFATSMQIESFKITRVKFNPQDDLSFAYRLRADVVVQDGYIEIINTQTSYPSTGQGYLSFIEGYYRNLTMKLHCPNSNSKGGDAVVPIILGTGSAHPHANLVIEDGFFYDSSCNTIVSPQGTSDYGSVSFCRNWFYGQDQLLYSNAAYTMKAKFSRNTIVDAVNGLVRTAAGTTLSVFSDGTNTLIGTSVWLNCASGTAKVYGWDIACDPITGTPLAAVAGQFFTSTRTGATNQGPARSNAANFVALGTGASGINTVIS